MQNRVRLETKKEEILSFVLIYCTEMPAGFLRIPRVGREPAASVRNELCSGAERITLLSGLRILPTGELLASVFSFGALPTNKHTRFKQPGRLSAVLAAIFVVSHADYSYTSHDESWPSLVQINGLTVCQFVTQP